MAVSVDLKVNPPNQHERKTQTAQRAFVCDRVSVSANANANAKFRPTPERTTTARDNGDDVGAQSKQKPAPNQRVYEDVVVGRTIDDKVLIRVHKQQHNILHSNNEAAPRVTHRCGTGD